MRRVVILTSLLMALGCAPAWAAPGNGLYAPYPAGTNPTAAQAYYAQLGVTLTDGQIRRGGFIGGLHASAQHGPSDRAGATAVDLGYAALAAVGLVALLAAGAAAFTGARRSPRMGSSPARAG